MGDDLPVGAYDGPFLFVPADYPLDDSVSFFPESGVDDPYSAGCMLFFPAAAGLPAVKDNGYIMAFQLFIFDKQPDELFPLSVQVIMINADKVVSVYDNR